MYKLGARYKNFFTQKAFVFSLIIGVAFLLLSLVVNFYAGTYATESAGNSVQDIVLSNIPVFDVDIIFLYGPIIFWVFAAIFAFVKPQKVPFSLKSIALFVIIRSVFVTLTHIGPFPDQVIANISATSGFHRFIFGGDLFFSAHTGLPFLMALIFWDDKKLRIIYIISAIFFGIIVLMGHLHYSIDVLAAFFITYTIYHIASVFFKKDKEYFNEVSDAE